MMEKLLEDVSFDAEDQQGTWQQIADNAAAMAVPLAQLVATGVQIAVVHGNGPQVGALSLQQEAAHGQVPAQPLHQLCAMTQGQLGSVLAMMRDLGITVGAGGAAGTGQSAARFEFDGVSQAEDVTGPYDVIVRAEAKNVDELGKLVVARVQSVDGITRTLTCPVVHL